MDDDDDDSTPHSAGHIENLITKPLRRDDNDHVGVTPNGGRKQRRESSLVTVNGAWYRPPTNVCGWRDLGSVPA